MVFVAICCRRADDELMALRHEQRQVSERLEALAAAEEAAAARAERAQAHAQAQARQAAAEMEQRLQAQLEASLTDQRRCGFVDPVYLADKASPHIGTGVQPGRRCVGNLRDGKSRHGL